MTASGILTIAVVLVMLGALAFEVLAPDVILFVSLAILFLTGVLTPQEAFQGFSNQGMLTVGILFIVAYAAQASGILESFAGRIMGRGEGLRRSLLRMSAPVVAMSAFLNNTPIVVMFTPAIRDWARARGLSPSKFLIPLSYASIFGGVCTLIGTSTNLVVNGLLQQEMGRSLSLFELAWVGVPTAVAGTLYLVTVGHRLLPDHRDPVEDLKESGREYLVEMEIRRGCALVGKTVLEAGLRNLQGLFLVEIFRDGESIAPVKPTDRMKLGDRLVFTGLVSSIAQLQRIEHLIPVDTPRMYHDLRRSGDARIIEAVVSRASPMLGQTIKQGNFRARYNAVVLAVHRHGERIRAKIGDIVLKPGDTLLLLASDDFLKTWNRSREFYMISKATDLGALDRVKSITSVVCLGGMIVLAGLGILSIFKAAILAAVVLILTRTVTPSEARRSIEWNVLIVIACAFGISKALDKTGAAAVIAQSLVGTVQGLGPLGALGAVYLVTSILTEVITNNAAAALAFPIAISAAAQVEADPMPFVIAVAVAASAAFATPFGYQTNMIVYGPGGYRFRDFLRIGLPLNLLFMVVALLVIPRVWGF
ncbi:MAG: SLC13 family permease [bacterium]|nr:MAG: SLC13 family permease [bacterium]